MSWGFISRWAKYPFGKESLRPFNARSENIEEKNYSVKAGSIKDA